MTEGDAGTRLTGGDAETGMTEGDAGTRLTGGDAETGMTEGDAGTGVTGGDAGARLAGGDAGAGMTRHSRRFENRHSHESLPSTLIGGGNPWAIAEHGGATPGTPSAFRRIGRRTPGGYPALPRGVDSSRQRRAACSSLVREATQRSPRGVDSFFQNGARVLR